MNLTNLNNLVLAPQNTIADLIKRLDLQLPNLQPTVGANAQAITSVQSGAGLDPIDEMVTLLGQVQFGDLQDLRAVGDRIRRANEDKKLLRQMMSDAAEGKFDKIQDTLDANQGLRERLGITSAAKPNEDEGDKEAIGRITDYLKGISDNVGDLTQELTFELQTIMTRINQATQLRSNISAKDSAAKDAVIGNIRG
ncbi:MAG: hypothetical protein IPG45_17470 [Deltaproteobacteria bacterium]|jgi:small-conductance mechanosensitive channel|nr:hypothetical protein [Deltaproteobacteria bacterium]